MQVCVFFSYLRWLKAWSQCAPSASLPLALRPLLWLRALSPIKAWASSASSLWPQTTWALCSASWSPAVRKSLWSCHRLTLLKMFPEPAFLLLLSASRHSGEGLATMEALGGAGLVSIRQDDSKRWQKVDHLCERTGHNLMMFGGVIPKSWSHDVDGRSPTQSRLRWRSVRQLSARRSAASDDSLIQLEDFSEQLRLKAN